MKKYIYVIKRINYCEIDVEIVKETSNIEYLSLNDYEFKKANKKIHSCNDILHSISGWIKHYKQNGVEFDYKEGYNIFLYFRDESDFNKVKERLEKEGYSETLIGLVERYYKEIKNTYYELKMCCLKDIYDLFQIEKLDIRNGSDFKLF